MIYNAKKLLNIEFSLKFYSITTTTLNNSLEKKLCKSIMDTKSSVDEKKDQGSIPHKSKINGYDIINGTCDHLCDFMTNFKQIIFPVLVSGIGGSLTNYLGQSNGSIDFARGLLLGFLQYIIYIMIFKHLGLFVYRHTGENMLNYKSATVLYAIGDIVQMYVPLYVMKNHLSYVTHHWNWLGNMVPFFSNWFIVDTRTPFSITLGYICGFVPSMIAFGLTLLTEESERDKRKLQQQRGR
jgi:hypothetical protein